MMDSADRPSPTLLQVLSSTLQRLEEARELSPDDPALQEFKRSILRLMADLQMKKESRKDARANPPEKASRSVVTLIVNPGQER